MLGLCGLTASCGLVRGAGEGAGSQARQHQDPEPGGRAVDRGPPRPARHPGMDPAQGVRRLLPCRKAGAACAAKLKELGCTAQLVGKLDNLAWLLNLRAMDIQCTPYAMAYCYVTPKPRGALHQHCTSRARKLQAELKANGVDALPSTTTCSSSWPPRPSPRPCWLTLLSVNFAVYETLREQRRPDREGRGRPPAAHEGREERGGAGPRPRKPICGTPWPWCGSRRSWKSVWLPVKS